MLKTLIMKLLRYLFLAMSGILLFTAPSFKASAQGTVQVIVSGVPPVLQSPYVNDIERNFRSGQYQFQIIYNNPDPAPVSFNVEITLSKFGQELFRMTSFPVTLTPGIYIYRTFGEPPAIEFAEDPVELISRTIQEEVVREGIVAEGDYLLEIELVPESSLAMISSIPSFTPFEIRFPQPPVLISPFDGGNAPAVFSVFSWTPVIGLPMFQFEYEVLIVEMVEGQTPYQAIQSNREHARITTMQPVMVYTAENLPLEPGNQYAWQVRASEVSGQIPIGDQGRTEIFTFTAGDSFFGDYDASQLQRIPLVPGFAELVNLENMNITSGSHSITMDGTATLRLDFSGSGASGFTEVVVTCSNLELRLDDIDNPVVLGGQVSGNISGEVFPVEDTGDIISLQGIRWGLTEGLTVDVMIADPAGSLIEAEGYLSLSASGFSGSVTATGPGGLPLFSYGVHPVELEVKSITALFPGAWITADASLSFFSEPTPCTMPRMELSGNLAEFSFACPVDFSIPIIPGTDLATLHLATATGDISFGENPSFDYSFYISSSLRINALEGSSYDVPVFLEICSENGVTADIRAPPLTYHAPDINLGIGELQIARFNDPWISYDPQANQWDFGLEFDAGLKFPSLDNLKLPDLYGITLDREGIHFPPVHFDEEDLYVVPRLDLAGFGARLTSFTIPAFTFPWFDWDGLLPGPWDFDFDFELTLPRFPDHMPYCLRNLKLDIENAGFSGGQFSAVLPSTSFSGNECAIELGAGYGVRLSSLAGELTGAVDAGEFSIGGHLSLDGSMLLGSPFACTGETVELGAENLFLSSTGIISGQVAGIIPSCPVGIGPYRASVTESLLSFSAGNSGQSALFEASANLEFPLQAGGTGLFGGSLGIDLVTGDFTSLNFEIDQPFVWKIPSEDEILVFNVNSAAISLDGLMIDGRNVFMAGTREIGVSFNEVMLDLKSFRIKQGNILFDEAFAFEAGIDSDFSLLYRSADPDDLLSLDPGIFFSLAGSVQIDSAGLRTSGSADAAMAFSGFSVNNLSVNFSDDFAFGLDPFKVSEGRMDVIYDNNLVAIVDQFGFHPVLSLFAIESVIPARLPVPHSSVAYLQLKDQQDNLLVIVEDDPDSELGVLISTIPGTTVDLVLPVLQGDLATAPRVGVQFSDVGLSLAPLRFEKGQIEVDVSGMAEFMDLEERFGLPFSLKHIAYGNFEEVHEILNEGLFFTGELKLFDEQLGENSMVTMFVQQDGKVMTSFELSDLDHDIPLVADSDIAVLNIGALSGFFEYPLLTPYALPEYEFSITGGFGVKYNENMARVDITAGYNRQGFRLIELDYDVSLQKPQFNLDPFIFRIDRVENLHLDYRKETGFDFYAGLDFTMGMKMEEGDLLIPLKGVEIRPSGFVIPYQEIHDGSSPALNVPPVSLFGISLQPLAFRMDGAEVNIYDFDLAGLAGLLPRVDFALTFPELASQFPDLAGVSLTVNDAGFSGGRFTGSVEVHSPLQPVRIPVGSTWLDIHEFSGNLTEVVRGDEPAQGIDLFIAGSVPGLDLFESDEPCDPIHFSFALVEGRGFSGTIENFVPCGTIPIGQLSLMFTGSSLQFGFEQGNQSAVLAGGAELIIPRAGNESETATATGTLEMDLMTGRLLDGSIEINDAFNWSLPAGSEDPFFNFVVNSARLDSLGLTLRANGDMRVGENFLVDVNFNDLVIGLDDFRVKDGEATISTGYSTGGELVSSGFAFELLFLPVHWRMVPGNNPVPSDTNVIRLNLDGIGATLNKDGLALSGRSTANIHLAQKLEQEEDPGPEPEPEEAEPEDIEISFAGLRLALIDNFMFDYRTKTVKSGVAQIWKDEEGGDSLLLAWYDSDGLGIGNFLGVLPIPDTLGLPDRDIAYLVLRENDKDSPDYGDLLVELNDGVLQSRTDKSVRLVLASLGTEEEDPPFVDITFSVTVNSAYEITGRLEVDLTDNPINVPVLPVSINSLAYERRDGGVNALTAGAWLDLPQFFGGRRINMDELTFSSQGFEQVSLSIGDESLSDTLAAYAFADSVLCINIYHLAASFGQQTSFDITGTMTSSLFAHEDPEEEEETGETGETGEADEADEGFSYIPFQTIFNREAHGPEWRFEFDLDELQHEEISISHARLKLIEIGAVASLQEFTVSMSGVVTMPELLGDDFAITVNQLSLGTNGIEVGGIEVQAERQEFSLFGDKVIIGVDQLRPDYDKESRVFKIGIDGDLTVLEKTAGFTNMLIGTDGSFGLDGLNIELLSDDLNIIENHLVLTAINFAMADKKLQLQVHGDATLPEPISETSTFCVSITHAGRGKPPDIKLEGLGFKFEKENRPYVRLGELATLELTGVDIDLDFDDIKNSTIYASAELEIEDEDAEEGSGPRVIIFGEPGDIRNKYGLRYNYNDGLSWNITSTPTPGNPLFTFSAGFFSIDIETLKPLETGEFGIVIGGKAGIRLPGLVGWAGFEGFTIAREGIREFGGFDGTLNATLMNVVGLSLENIEASSEPTTIYLVRDSDDDPENPNIESLEVLEYLLVEGAGITLNGKEQGDGNGNGGSRDAYGGGVESLLFYRTLEGGVMLQIVNASLEVPAAELTVSMTYYSGMDGRLLSVAGSAKFGAPGAAVDIGVAGKISTIGDDLSFGLFVKVGTEGPGIPLIPQVITLKGLGGGFYYNPVQDDFDKVRSVTNMHFPSHDRLEAPSFKSGTRFAVFLYAAAGLIGDPKAYIDGEVFLEITPGVTSVYTNASLFFQGERLKAYSALSFFYGTNQPMVQGLCSLAVDYKPALHGGAILGFFAKPGPEEDPSDVLWAVFGEIKEMNLFIAETNAHFIVCNDGFLANLEIDASPDLPLIKLDASLLASVWYLAPGPGENILTADLGAYGEIKGMISIAGASAHATLFGAFVSRHGERFLYAQGEVGVDLILWDGSASAWVSYGRAGWDGGTGSNPEFQAKIDEAKEHASNLGAAAEQAATDVAEAIKKLKDAEDIGKIVEEIDRQIAEIPSVEDRRIEMNNRIAAVMNIESEVTGRLRSTVNHLVDLRDQTRAVSRELSDPLTWSDGTISGHGTHLVVTENPTINVDQTVAQNNETELEDYIQNIELQLEYYEEAIAGTMLNLMELERMIEGSGQLSAIFLNTTYPIMGDRFRTEIESAIQLRFNDSQPAFQENLPGFHGPSHMPEELYIANNTGSFQTFSQSSHNFNDLSERFTQAVEAIKDFYSHYIFWACRTYVFASDDDRAQAAKLLLHAIEDRFNTIFPPLELMHITFTQSLDILYTLKAEITATLYGMIEEYMVLRAELQNTGPENVREINQPGTLIAASGEFSRMNSPRDGFHRAGDERSAEMADLRNQIAGMLEPPVISSMVINPGDPETRYRNWADISWQAHHPGNVAETSYLITSAGTDGQFTSAGKLGSLRHYTWNILHVTDNLDVPVNTYNFSVRSRGSGGNTTIRSAVVDLKIGSGTSSSGEQITGIVPPPSTPVVELPYQSVLTTTQTYQPASGGGGFTPADGFGASGSSGSSAGIIIQNRFYSNEGSRLRLSIIAHDEQTDIHKFEYALGSSQGQTDIVDWRQAVGVTSNTGAGGSGVTRRMETTIHGLNLEHGGRYYISVRVTNSAGKTSSFSMSAPVVYDAMPPSSPGYASAGLIDAATVQPVSSSQHIPGYTAISEPSLSPQIYDVVSQAPSFFHDKVNYPAGYAGEPSITRNWTAAEDDLSGISGYEYILTPFNDATHAFTLDSVQFTTGLTATVTGGVVSWTDTLYFHVRSRNNAGSVSREAITYGPLVVHDPTMPTRPAINVMVQGTGVNVYLPQLSGDYESQVAGYQYSIGTSPGATNIRSWSDHLDFDHGWITTYSKQVRPEPAEVPVFNIPGGEFSAYSMSMYVNVRAVNRQKMVSPVVSSGPFSLNTLPREPIVKHNLNNQTGMLDINIENIADDGAPVSGVQYRVRDIESGRTLQDWTGIDDFSDSRATGRTGGTGIGIPAQDTGIAGLDGQVSGTTGTGTVKAGSASTSTQVEGFGNAGLAVDVQATSTTGHSTTTTVQNTTTTAVQSSVFNPVGITGFR